MIQTTAAISPGSSGGGLFDSEGRLVGFTTLYIVGGQSLNSAMPVEWLSEIKLGVTKAKSGRSRVDWLKRVAILEKRKDWHELLTWGREWTIADPKSADAWHILGLAYSRLKRYSEAIDAPPRALEDTGRRARSLVWDAEHAKAESQAAARSWCGKFQNPCGRW